MQEPTISLTADVAPDLSGETPAVSVSPSARERLAAPLPDAYGALQPFLPCAPEEARHADYLDAAAVLFRNLERDRAPDITPLVREIGLDRINGAGRLTYEDAAKALDRIVSLLPEEEQANIQPVVRKIRSEWASARDPLCYEAIIEVLEYAAEYIEVEEPEVGLWLRTVAEQELRKRFGRETAERLLNRYVEPPPPGEPPYGEDGILRSEDLSEQRVVPWLADGMIQAGTVGMWIGPFSSGKTFGAIALGLALAFEREFMGQDTNGGGHVRYIAAEGLASFDRRLAGWLVHHGLLPRRFSREELADALDGRFDLTGGGLRLNDPRLEEVLIRTIQEDGTRLLVLDTLGRLLGAEQSDEDNSVANSVMAVLTRVAAVTGCTILVVHHPGHTQTHRGRGASAWQQAADWVVVSKGNLKGSKPVRLVNTKQRDAELFEDVAYRLRPLSGVECNGEPWSAALFEPADVDEATDLPLRDRILFDVQANPGSSLRQVRARVRGDASEIGDEIIRMVSDGVLEDKGEGSRYDLYDNPDRDEFEVDAEMVGDLSNLTDEKTED